MIDEKQAYSIAAALLGRAGDDPVQPWHLAEFSEGWLIKETGDKGDAIYGMPSRVIEKESGRVLRFPSFVPPGRIIADYDAVVSDGRVVSQ
jgi:hypothetical protein